MIRNCNNATRDSTVILEEVAVMQEGIAVLDERVVAFQVGAVIMQDTFIVEKVGIKAINKRKDGFYDFNII